MESEKSQIQTFAKSLKKNVIVNDKICPENILMTKALILKIFSLIEQFLDNKIEPKEFWRKLFGISKEMECVFKISLLLSKILQTYNHYDYFFSLIFEKNFAIGLFFLNSLDYICELPPFPFNYNYATFIEEIRANTNTNNNINCEENHYIQIFKTKDPVLIRKYVKNIKGREYKYIENKEILKKIFETQENNNQSINKSNIKNEKEKLQDIEGKNVKIKINNSMKNEINKESIKIKEIKEGNSIFNGGGGVIEINKKEEKITGKEKEIFEPKYENNNNSSSNINKIITNKNAENKDKIIQQKKSMRDYFKEKKNFYDGKNTPILNYIVNNKKDLKRWYFYFDDLEVNNENMLYGVVLSNLLIKLKANKNYPDENKYGYFCFYDKNNNLIESIYTTVEPETIYNYSNQLIDMLEEDDYKDSDPNIANLAFKSRALSFEFYINKPIFIKKIKAEEYPRVIFPMKKVIKIDEDINDIIFDDLNYDATIEIDGAFLIKNDCIISTKDIPFKDQGMARKEILYDPHKKKDVNDMIIDYNNSFVEGDLCLLEIKNSFPPAYYSKNGPKPFNDIIDNMFNRAYIYIQLFNHLNVSYKRIRLMLLYEAVRKKGFWDVIDQKLNEFLSNHTIEYGKKINFQVIYLNSSYFGVLAKTSEDKIEYLENKVAILEKKVKEISNEIAELKKKNEK